MARDQSRTAFTAPAPAAFASATAPAPAAFASATAPAAANRGQSPGYARKTICAMSPRQTIRAQSPRQAFCAQTPRATLRGHSPVRAPSPLRAHSPTARVGISTSTPAATPPFPAATPSFPASTPPFPMTPPFPLPSPRHSPLRFPDMRKHGVTRRSFVSKHYCSALLEKHYEEVRELGKGAYGRVTLVREVTTGQERVCKTVSTAGLGPELIDMMKKEIELLSTLDHPGVVKLYEYAEDVRKQQFVLILEYLPGGSCDMLLKDGQAPPSEALVAQLICQLLTSLEYCHSRGIVHRDVKPENMMLAREASAHGLADCKLIDFGFAGKAKAGADSLVGTAAYIAPEMIRFQPHTPKIDIWAAGVTTFQLLSGALPFGKDAEVNMGPNQPIFQRILKYQGFEELEDQFTGAAQNGASQTLSVHKWWNRRSAECREFVRWLLHPNADVRPTAAEALEHPWLRRYQPRQAKLTREMADSLIGYAQAPSVAQCCLLIVAGRLGIPDLEELGAAFLSADRDGDGKISREDLQEALEHVQGSWWWKPTAEIDVDKVLEAADPDHTGGMGYTEFVAACIYARHGSIEELARQAFYAMDADRDGWVHMQDARELFRERDARLLQSLPQMRPFSMLEWCTTMVQQQKQELAMRPKLVVYRRSRSFGC